MEDDGDGDNSSGRDDVLLFVIDDFCSDFQLESGNHGKNSNNVFVLLIGQRSENGSSIFILKMKSYLRKIINLRIMRFMRKICSNS